MRRSPARINPKLRCPHCAQNTATNAARRVVKTTSDDLLDSRVTGRTPPGLALRRHRQAELVSPHRPL